MKTKYLFFLPIFIFLLFSCENEETIAEDEITLSAIVIPDSFSAKEAKEIMVKITTGTPCYSIDVDKTVSGSTYTYNFILTEENVACIQVVTEHEIPVVFDPPVTGTYILEFLVDGKVFETREIIVSEYSLLGTWEVLRFEDEAQNIIMSAPEEEEILVTFGSSDINGRTTRNEYEGEYQVQGNHNLLLTEFVTTEQEETEFGKMFYDAIIKEQMHPLPFEVNETTLKINYEENRYMILIRL